MVSVGLTSMSVSGNNHYKGEYDNIEDVGNNQILDCEI